MMRFLSALPLALGLLSGPAAADSWPTPAAAYEATRVMDAGGRQMSGRLFHDRGKERWEVEMQGSFAMHLEGLHRGDQPADLFELPAGVQVMPADPAMVNPAMQGQ
jgi:hypothetical protein